jgi:hypothetical protein
MSIAFSRQNSYAHPPSSPQVSVGLYTIIDLLETLQLHNFKFSTGLLEVLRKVRHVLYRVTDKKGLSITHSIIGLEYL